MYKMFSSSISDIIATNLNKHAGITINKHSLKQIIDLSIEEFKLNGDLRETSGPSLWHTIHWIASISDNENTDAYIHLLGSIVAAHPCHMCREDFKSILFDHIPPVSPFLKHSVDVHNLVNEKLGKPIFPYEKALQVYNYEKCEECTFKPASCQKHGNEWVCK